ncbi:MAG TPA: TolC family protein [Terracidiphilus sp.]|jgi:outer membrane protein TolC|nr:TolC family protein [Terracidiphilus sp.]
MRQQIRRGERRRRLTLLPGTLLILVMIAVSRAPVSAQTPSPAAPQADSASSQPVIVTLEEAIQRAEKSEPSYASASATSRTSALDVSIARAGLLPSARYNSQGIYTQPNGINSESGEGVTTPNPKFVANDSRPREYMAQGVVDETLSLAGPASVRRAQAASAMARAQLEIARRGLVSTVTGLFYGLLAADQKVNIAQRAYQDAADFTSITSKREKQGEAAHADVLKAQLTEQQQWRGLQDAKLAADNSRLNLGVLLFVDPRTTYLLKESETEPPLPPFSEVGTAAAKNNPELKNALGAVAVSNADVLGARAALWPTLGLNVTYGIDANEFAVNGPMTPSGLKARNLGYSTSFTLNLPIWDWLATEHKVKQSEIRRDEARVALTAAQRQSIANLQAYYAAAQTAQTELGSLEASVATAAESLRLSELRYKGGEALVIEVVDAQNAYVAAENAREDGRVRYRTALADLQTLTGTM